MIKIGKSIKNTTFAIGTRPNTSIVRDTNLFNLNNDGFLSTIKHDNSFFIANYNGVMVSQIEICILNTLGALLKQWQAPTLCQLLNKVLDNSKHKSINRKHFFKFKRKIFINCS